MFEGPGPLPITQLPNGRWVEKDPEIFARECREQEKAREKPTNLLEEIKGFIKFLFNS